MRIKVTARQAFIANQPAFKDLLKRCEAALVNPVMESDPVNGMSRYIRVDAVDDEDYIRKAVIELYTAAGWKWITDRYIGEIRFVVQEKD